ncbi:MAG: putative sugar nucleotidyl transferase [Ginsengibacter sp.]
MVQKIILDDVTCKGDLYPFDVVRSVLDIRVGILTLREKWDTLTKNNYTTVGERTKMLGNELLVEANVIPTISWFKQMQKDNKTPAIQLIHPWHIFQTNTKNIIDDFELLCQGRVSASISESNKLVNQQDIFLEEGAVVEHCVINASEGPVYIGKNALVMEGCMLRGPVAICKSSVIKMGAKIYGGTTIGPFCVAAGEIKNSIMFGYSNKAHDGYLGDAVIAEWCNLGAGTSNSNLKNTAGVVKAWKNKRQSFIEVGLKCGLLMGDYSRCAINTSFNTGTVVGVCSNIFGAGFPAKYIPDFTWGIESYKFEKVIADIDNWKKLKGQLITETEIKLLTDIYSKQNLRYA